MPTRFAHYKNEGHTWITLATGDYYPDILADACKLYQPVLELFGQMLRSSESSTRLFLQIAELKQPWMRIQLNRVFRKYVSPTTPVEMLKRKSKAPEICRQFGHHFRPIHQVHAAFNSRPIPDEALCALLWEYKDRGQKGYDLTERFFDLFKTHQPQFTLKGPKRAGQDIRLGTIFPDYPNPKRPVDFLIYDGATLLAIGLARYDSDRGGTQEDDRTGGYHSCAHEIVTYFEQQDYSLKPKIIFLNDGPGLLLGSMWDDYAALEERWADQVMVLTLRMVTERLSSSWLLQTKE